MTDSETTDPAPQDAAPADMSPEAGRRIQELEAQLSDLRYLMARYQEALYEAKKEMPEGATPEALEAEWHTLENLILMVPRSVLRLARSGRPAIERPWKKHFYRHPFKASEWGAMRRAQRRIRKQKG